MNFLNIPVYVKLLSWHSPDQEKSVIAPYKIRALCSAGKEIESRKKHIDNLLNSRYNIPSEDWVDRERVEDIKRGIK